MEYIKKEELIEGEIYYVSTTYGFWMIGLVTKSNNGDNSNCDFRGNATFISKRLEFNKDRSWCYKASDRTYRLATSEEKHWLETCIKENKFVSYEEAMKSFIPEYVELLPGWSSDGEFVGEIFDTKKDFQEQFKKFKFVSKHADWKEVLRLNWIPKFFKPSTKEAYDAQFVVKEPAENKTELEIWLENTKSLNLSLEDLEKYIGFGQTCNFDNIYIKLEGHYSKGRAKILFDKWNEKVIEPLPQFKVIETIETITKVENNEGNQFFIGDVVISSNGTIQTIESFDYNKAKTNIIAFTNKQSILGNGIGIDKIEHYIEPKTDYKILEYKTEGGISCKAPFLADSHQFYINERCKIYSIKRISDDLIITVGDDVLSKTCSVPNKILSIELINNKIRLYPRNSFYNLEDIIKVKDETLLEKAKRLYPVGTKVKTVTSNNFEIIIKDQSKFKLDLNNNISVIENYMVHLYCSHKNKWAEIIK